MAMIQLDIGEPRAAQQRLRLMPRVVFGVRWTELVVDGQASDPPRKFGQYLAHIAAHGQRQHSACDDIPVEEKSYDLAEADQRQVRQPRGDGAERLDQAQIGLIALVAVEPD